MAAPGPLLLLICVLTLAANIAYGGYYITTPRKWSVRGQSQVCVSVTNPQAPAGSLTLELTSARREKVFHNSTLQCPAGKSQQCIEVEVPDISESKGEVHVSGTLEGVNISHKGDILFNRRTKTTFLQTDKYLYKPGQNVKFRILTLTGYDARVSTEQYPEVWVTTPSRTRIAQWRNVDNSAGLVHLDFDLADEPEEGNYLIHLRRSGETLRRATLTTSFRVEEFVLPRFEIALKPPSYILASDEVYTFSVCANYTFGQPVKGNLTFVVNNRRSLDCRNEFNRNIPIYGCTDVEVTAAEMQTLDCDVYSLTVTATVTEEGTGVEIKDEKSVSITRSAITFQTVYDDQYKKPNLPFTMRIRAQLPDSSPAAGVPMEVCAVGRCNNMTTAPDGIFTVVLPSPKTKKVLIKSLNSRAALDQSQFSKTLRHYFSPSNSSLLIHAPEGKLKCVPGVAQEHVLPVLFSAANHSSARITVQVISRGRIQYWNTEKHKLISGDLPISEEHLVEPLPPPPENIVRGVVNVKVYLPPAASPEVMVLVWYNRDDGEVVSDVRELKVEKCLENTVNLTWSVAQAQPGEQASLSLASEPNSVCSLGVVDRSTELLAKKPDPITLEKVFDFTNSFRSLPFTDSYTRTTEYCQAKFQKEAEVETSTRPDFEGFPHRIVYSYSSDYHDAIQAFDDAGVHLFTDFTVETRPCMRRVRYTRIRPSIFFARPSRPVNAVPVQFDVTAGGVITTTTVAPTGLESNGDNISGGVGVVEPPRTNFPETWLWDLTVIPPSGVNNQDLTLPDTITQWVGKAVCSHPEKGVGLSNKETIITFTPFFVDLTLPPTVKRGEILPVKISIFNYLGQSIPVTVVMVDSPEYEILKDSATKGLGEKRSSCLPAQDKVVHTVKIRPMAIGDVNITVVAFVDHEFPGTCGSGDTSIRKRDALIKPIKVEPEGLLREQTWTKYICSKDFETGDDSLEMWELETPSVIVEGSERGWVTAVGDLLALSLENLGHLIRMPYGCGEQNMINFAPNIFIMQYLTASNQTTPESTEKLLNYIRKGYQRELRYRRDNGSYSAFGNNDDSGSTWLTAFVLKSFAQAQEYITVDETVLESASSWLRKQQKEDGCFNSVGKILHKGLKGGIAGSDSLVPLTSYVMISLLEAGEDPTSSNVSAAAKCLKADTSQDPYTLALKAYALALGRLPEGETVLQQLLDQAIVAKNSTYWELPKGPGKSKSIEVETAGYAILAMMTQDPENFEQQARKVVKWITTQRNGQGGFYSTQDTVVALQAMAVYESHLHQGPLNVVATVTATGLTHSFTVTDNNKLLQQLVTLPTLPTSVSMTMEGQGCAVLQAVLRYNIPEPEQNEAFSLSVNTSTAPDSRCVTKSITACAAYLLPDGESNMALIQVDLISGYIPEKQDLKKLVKDNVDIKRYEVDGSLVTFYIAEMTGKDTCVTFRVIREVDVENVKAGTVTVLDYYQQELTVSKRYTLPPSTECL